MFYSIDVSMVVKATETSQVSIKDDKRMIIGPQFVRTPPSFVRFSNSTGDTLYCAAKGNPIPVSL